MATRFDFVSPYSPAECIRRLQELGAKRHVLLGAANFLFRSKIDAVVVRRGPDNEVDRAGFRLGAGVSVRYTRHRVGLDFRVSGYLEGQGASTRVVVDIAPGPLVRALAVFLLLALATLFLIATLLKAYNLDEFLRISFAAVCLLALLYGYYRKTFSDLGSRLASLLYEILTVPGGTSGNLSVLSSTRSRHPGQAAHSCKLTRSLAESMKAWT